MEEAELFCGRDYDRVSGFGPSGRDCDGFYPFLSEARFASSGGSCHGRSRPPVPGLRFLSLRRHAGAGAARGSHHAQSDGGLRADADALPGYGLEPPAPCRSDLEASADGGGGRRPDGRRQGQPGSQCDPRKGKGAGISDGALRERGAPRDRGCVCVRARRERVKRRAVRRGGETGGGLYPQMRGAIGPVRDPGGGGTLRGSMPFVPDPAAGKRTAARLGEEKGLFTS